MTHDNLRDQIEALKAKKEQVTSGYNPSVAPKAPHAEAAEKAPAAPDTHTCVDRVICERTDYTPEFKGNRREINTARTRCWGVVATHAFCPPAASLMYAAKNGYWGATVAATAVAVVGVPLTMADGGFTLLVGAPATSLILNIKQITDQRKRLGITTVAQADAMKFSTSF